MPNNYKFSKKSIQLNPDRIYSNSLHDELNKIQKYILQNITFSRFKYWTIKNYNYKPNSKYLAQKYAQGNCVAFSFFTRQVLIRNGFYDAVIVGSTPPERFKRPGYLPISHAAVVLPCNCGFFLFDGSFYFPEAVFLPIHQLSDYSNPIIQVKNVYSKVFSPWSFKLHSKNNQHSISHEEELLLQKAAPYLPSQQHKNIPYICAQFDNQFCIYYLYKIFNPDEAITVHTNMSDKRIFHCKINKHLDIELYYALDYTKPIPMLVGFTNKHTDIPSIPIDAIHIRSQFNLTEWIELFGIKDPHEKKKMYENIIHLLQK